MINGIYSAPIYWGQMTSRAAKESEKKWSAHSNVGVKNKKVDNMKGLNCNIF